MDVRIAITDDHPMVRDGLAAMLQAAGGITITAKYASGNALLAGLKTDVPDVLLLDMHLPDMHGREIVKALRKQFPGLKIIIVTSTESVFLVKAMLDAGARAYLLKTAGQDQLTDAIRQVMAGEVVLSPEVKELLLKNALKQKSNLAYNEELTEREIRILELIAEELTSPEIAEQLHLSQRTIENYRLGLMQKLGAKNMAGLVKKAILMGIIR